MPAPPPSLNTMQCMEVRGGNRLVDTAFDAPGLSAWVYSKPYHGDDGGGDVHYVSSCATGRVTRLLVADVSGHGAGVCDVAGGLQTLMRRFVNFIDQTEFVRSMNRQFVSSSASSCFATAVVLTFFGPTNGLSLCNAGHPAPLWYRAKTRSWELLDLDEIDRGDVANIPLGLEDLTRYEQFDVTLGLGDLVLCYTDSLMESEDADGKMLGPAGLLEVVRTLDASRPGTLTAALLATIASLHAGNLDGDDVTVLLFQPTGVGMPPRMTTKLLAPVRIARAVLRSLRRGGGPLPLPEWSVSNIGGAMFGFLNHFRKPKGRVKRDREVAL